MRRVTIIWCLITWMVMIPAASNSADVAKIGTIDFQRILETSDAGKTAQARINERGKLMERELKQKGAEIEELRKKLEREALVMSKEMREEKERQIRININDLKSMQAKYINEFKAKEGQLIQGIQKEVFKLVEDIGNKEGFLLILEKREAGVVYGPSTIDLTDRVIQLYNAEYAKRRGTTLKEAKE